jgi:23S rRNA (guanine745-N1)-methyltransferase
LPPVVPQPLAAIAELLICPVCGSKLSPVPGGLACANGHHHDLAREGYVALLGKPVGRAAGDDAPMVSARVETEAAGHLDPMTAAIADAAATPAASDHLLAVDIGAGTGHNLTEVLRRSGRGRGVAIDVSRAACRSIARSHPSLAVVRADVWAQIPLADASVDLALDAFAPRNGAELGRVMRPGGTLVVATAGQGHLKELRRLHSLSVHPDKAAQLRRQLEPWFREVASEPVEWPLSLIADAAANLLRMGPSARHLHPRALEELARSEEPIAVSAAVEITTFVRVAS